MADVKAQMRRFYDEVANAHNLDAIDSLVSPNFVEHEVFPGLPNDASAVKAFFGMMFEAFPDFHIDVADLLADGDKAVARTTMSGTHKGTFMDIPATGKRFEVATIDILRFEGERFAEHWGITDQMAMMQQLGVVPE